MFPLLGGLISGGASLLGSIFSSNTSAANTQAQIQAQQQMQMQSEQWMTNMSNTAYQRATKDMTAAGLNPAMMFGSGSAASSPGIGTPTVPMSQRQSPIAGLGQAVQQGLNTAVQVKTYDKMVEEIANIKADAAKRAAETVTEEKRPEQVAADTLVKENVAAQLANKMPEARLAGASAQSILNMPQWLQDATFRSNFVTGGIKSVGDAISSFVPSAKGVSRLLANPDEPSKKYTGLGPTGTQTVKDMIDEALSEIRGR